MRTCTKCGAVVPEEEARFCGHCGAPLDGALTSSSQAPKPPADSAEASADKGREASQTVAGGRTNVVGRDQIITQERRLRCQLPSCGQLVLEAETFICSRCHRLMCQRHRDEEFPEYCGPCAEQHQRLTPSRMHEEALRQTLGDWLLEIREAMARRGWESRVFGEPVHMIQTYRPEGWPRGENKVHYEIAVPDDLMRRRVVHLWLHVEDDTPWCEQVRRRVRQLLRPHTRRLLERCGCALTDEPSHQILKASLPVSTLSLERLKAAFEAMAETGTFVDEALALSRAEPVYRNEFSSGDKPVQPEWFGDVGGQRAVAGPGRLGSRAWMIDGSRPNARDVPWEKGSYCVIASDVHDLIRNAQEYTVCLVIKTQTPGRVHLWADGHWHNAHGDLEWLPRAFYVEDAIEGSNSWQCIMWQMAIPPVDEVTGPVVAELGGGDRTGPFDFASEGVWVVLNVETEDSEFAIDSLTIAAISPAADAASTPVVLKGQTVSNPHFARDLRVALAHGYDIGLNENTVAVVTGTHAQAEIFDRPVAERLRDALDARGDLHSGRRAIVISDKWFEQGTLWRARPHIAVGGPLVNSLASELLETHEAAEVQPGVFVLVSGRSVGLWGDSTVETQAAVDHFISDCLDEWIDWVWH